jgi:hypothetical protein
MCTGKKVQSQQRNEFVSKAMKWTGTKVKNTLNRLMIVAGSEEKEYEMGIQILEKAERWQLKGQKNPNKKIEFGSCGYRLGGISGSKMSELWVAKWYSSEFRKSVLRRLLDADIDFTKELPGILSEERKKVNLKICLTELNEPDDFKLLIAKYPGITKETIKNWKRVVKGEKGIAAVAKASIRQQIQSEKQSALILRAQNQQAGFVKYLVSV